MRSYFLRDTEDYWSGFLIDLKVRELLPLFEQLHLKAKVTDYDDAPATVHESREEGRTAVTANEADFIRYFLDHQNRDSGVICQDC